MWRGRDVSRSYDPVAGQFTSADSVQDGLNRYGYVGGNPETATDPSGHIHVCEQCDLGGGSSGPAPTPTPTPTQPTKPKPTGGDGGDGGGSSGSGGGSSNGALTWASWQLSVFGYQIAGYALATALQQDNVGAVIKEIAQVVANMVKHPSRVKFGGRFASRTAALDGAQSGADMLAKVSKALIAIGALADFAGAAIAFYNGNVAEPRWDLSGPKRLAAAVWYG